ncbi:MAG TPA: hypothetical protein VJV78_47375 [Polyangiales bacterium]|nr:hypothetical protein [Polyangiales bacterium]
MYIARFVRCETADFVTRSMKQRVLEREVVQIAWITTWRWLGTETDGLATEICDSSFDVEPGNRVFHWPFLSCGPEMVLRSFLRLRCRGGSVTVAGARGKTLAINSSKAPSPMKTTASHTKPREMSVSDSVSKGKLIRRAEAARLLGVSVSTLRRREGNELQPIVGPDGVHMFDESEVRSVMVTVRRTQTSTTLGSSAGHIAAEVFSLLDAGEHPVEIVKQLKLPPDQVVALRDQWSEMRGGFIVSAREAAEFGRLARASTPKAAASALAQLRHRLEAITEMRRGSAKCCVCGDATASICEPCVVVENGPLASFGVDVEHRKGPTGLAASSRTCTGTQIRMVVTSRGSDPSGVRRPTSRHLKSLISS